MKRKLVLKSLKTDFTLNFVVDGHLVFLLKAYNLSLVKSKK